MPKIVNIELKRSRPERFIVYWDDGQVHVFSPETALRYGFTIDREFEEVELFRILEEDSIRRAKDQALRYLEIRPHSRRELKQKLLKKGYIEPVIENALADLEKVDLINDRQFARLFIQNELALRPCGKMLLRQKLISRGIPPDIFEPLLDELYPEPDQESIVKQLAEKFLKRSAGLPLPKKREKLIRHLQSKGFGWDVIHHLLFEENMLDATDGDSA